MFQKFKRRFSTNLTVPNILQGSNDSLFDDQPDLSEKEIQLVRETWTLLRNDLAGFKFLGAELFIRYFTKYPDYQQKFKSFKDVPINFQQNRMIRIDKKLMAHGTYVMYTIGMLVDNLENPDMMGQMLKRLARNHYHRHVSLKAFEQLRDTLLEHLLVTLGPQLFNKKTMIAWRKAFGYLLKEIDKNFKLLESDLERSGSYYRLNSLHHNAKHELMQDYRRNCLLDYQLRLRKRNEQYNSTLRTSRLMNSPMSNESSINMHDTNTNNQSKIIINQQQSSPIIQPVFYQPPPSPSSSSQQQQQQPSSQIQLKSFPASPNHPSVLLPVKQSALILPPSSTNTINRNTFIAKKKHDKSKNFLWKTLANLRKKF
ncbi:uncharacterized protein LOC124497075 [Dermatophagoides farinae]|uniref:Globin domain-containing protein n=1 Tax=Dermatophagoides farinae TaxID=6954 RepID=A0A922L1I1_DERFA|nr:hypothetical protein DERF_012219 [Dermatophagoides farinae]